MLNTKNFKEKTLDFAYIRGASMYNLGLKVIFKLYIYAPRIKINMLNTKNFKEKTLD